jgi:hypothetical protein
MKLNLLPTYVSKEKQSRTAWVVSILVAVMSIIGALAMITLSAAKLDKVKEEARALEAPAAEAVAVAASADVIIDKSKAILTNIELATQMKEHNRAYPALYDSMKAYIPGFFRVTQMTATPNDATTSTVTMTGVLKSYQQYADLMLALLRNPEVTTVSRTGFQNVDPYIPELSDVDQFGRPRKPGEPPVPDDPLQRLAQRQATGRQDGFTGAGGFGTTDTGPRGAMPGYSLVTVSVVIGRNLQTPVPKATLTGIKSSSTNTNTNTPSLPGQNVPAPGGPPGGPGSPGGPGRESPGGGDQ